MPKRSSKDLNTTAFNIVQEAIGEAPKSTTAKAEKNPAAVSLGRLGGLKGGKARAEALSAKQKNKIAKEGAAKKWAKYYAQHPKKK
jgi:hypothetical protein